MTEHQKAQIDKLAALFKELLSTPVTEPNAVRRGLQKIRAFIESEPDTALRDTLMAQSTALVEAMIAVMAPAMDHAWRALGVDPSDPAIQRELMPAMLHTGYEEFTRRLDALIELRRKQRGPAS